VSADLAAVVRPSLTVTEAADATGKSRRTLGRLLDAGRLDGAYRDDAGTWRIPVDALLSVGLHLHAPSSPPADVPADVASPASTSTPPPTPPDELAAVRAELADWRRRAEVAEAIATERAAALDDARAALRMLTAAPPPITPTTSPTTSPESRRWWRKTR